MKRSALWLILLAGCTPPPPTTADALDAVTVVVGGFPHRGPQPLNCGTPYSFKICPVPVAAVQRVTLPALSVPTVDIVVIPDQLPPLPPLPQLAADPE